MAGEVAQRAIEIAHEYVGKQESKLKPNWAPWLEFLFERAGGKELFGWKAPLPYCIAAAAACFEAAAKELGKNFPLAGKEVIGEASTQTFYENAKKMGLTGQTPEVGDTVIFRLAQKWQGHAGIVVGVNPDSISTIEFNTSGTVAGSQRNGDGCYLKLRRFADFQDKTKLHIRGYVKTSTF